MAQFNLSVTLEYDIITAQDDRTLVIRVNEFLQNSKGWQPLGGVISHRGILCQTVVREKPKSVAEKIIDEVTEFKKAARY